MIFVIPFHPRMFSDSYNSMTYAPCMAWLMAPLTCSVPQDGLQKHDCDFFASCIFRDVKDL